MSVIERWKSKDWEEVFVSHNMLLHIKVSNWHSGPRTMNSESLGLVTLSVERKCRQWIADIIQANNHQCEQKSIRGGLIDKLWV